MKGNIKRPKAVTATSIEYGGCFLTTHGSLPLMRIYAYGTVEAELLHPSPSSAQEDDYVFGVELDSGDLYRLRPEEDVYPLELVYSEAPKKHEKVPHDWPLSEFAWGVVSSYAEQKKKIQGIKAIRDEDRSLGLKESKELYEKYFN